MRRPAELTGPLAHRRIDEGDWVPLSSLGVSTAPGPRGEGSAALPPRPRGGYLDNSIDGIVRMFRDAPSTAGRAAEAAAVPLASLLPGVGFVQAIAEADAARREWQAGNYGRWAAHQALGTLNAGVELIPGAAAGLRAGRSVAAGAPRGAVPSEAPTPAAPRDPGAPRAPDRVPIGEISAPANVERAMLARRVSPYEPGSIPQRPFHEDYPHDPGRTGPDVGAVPGGGLGGGGSPLTRTRPDPGRPEGSDITAPVVAGRRAVGGDDVRLSLDELQQVARGIIGRDAEFVPRSRVPRRADGAYVVEAGPDGPVRRLLIADDLGPGARYDALAHEIGHRLDEIAGVPRRGGATIPPEGVRAQLDRVYNDLVSNSVGRQRNLTRPEHLGYPPAEAPYERMADAFRAYQTNPNDIETYFPELAARIREYVNEHPELRRIIQFNALPITASGAALAAALAPAPAEAAPRERWTAGGSF